MVVCGHKSQIANPSLRLLGERVCHTTVERFVLSTLQYWCVMVMHHTVETWDEKPSHSLERVLIK